jgi:hypothetical protein
MYENDTGAYCYFNISTGALGTNNIAGAVPFISALANGWYRIGFVKTTASTTNYVVFGLADGDNSLNVTAGRTIYLWGAQLEAGSFPTSYIPTTTTSVARAADNVNSSSVSWLTQGTGALLAYAKIFDTASGTSGVFSLNDDTSSNRVDCRTNNTAHITNGAAAQAALTAASGFVVDVLGKVAIAYTTNDMAIVFDGGAAATDVSGTPPTTVTQWQLGGLDGSQFNQLNGYITRVAYWNSRLSNSALQALTA